MNRRQQQQVIEYNLDRGVAEDFDRVMFRLRRVKRKRVRKAPLILEEVDVQDVDLLSEGRRVRMKVKVDDYYFVAYQKVVNGIPGKLWEARLEKEKARLGKSEPLNFSVNYTGGVDYRSVGFKPIKEAFETLWSEKPPSTNIEPAFQTLAINLCETARFQPCFAFVYQCINDRTPIGVPRWMSLMINSWEDTSDVAKMPLPPSMTKKKLPRDLKKKDKEDYMNFKNYQQLLDPKENEAAVYFARCCIRIPHIKGPQKDAKTKDKLKGHQ